MELFPHNFFLLRSRSVLILEKKVVNKMTISVTRTLFSKPLQGFVTVCCGRGQPGHGRLDAPACSSSLGTGGGVQPARRQHVQHGSRQQRGEPTTVTWR